MFKLVAIIVVVIMGYTYARPQLGAFDHDVQEIKEKVAGDNSFYARATNKSTVNMVVAENTVSTKNPVSASNAKSTSTSGHMCSPRVNDWREAYPDQYDMSKIDNKGGK